MPGNEIYYWDSCIFLAWLRDETQRPDVELSAIKAIVRKIQNREVQIMTSAIMYAEVTGHKLPVGVDEQFFELMRRSNMQVVSADIRVAKMARDLRDYYSMKPDDFNNKTLSTPDAIHLATAILYKATEFHTLDASNKKSLGLLGLDGDVGGHRLRVCKPEQPQVELGL